MESRSLGYLIDEALVINYQTHLLVYNGLDDRFPENEMIKKMVFVVRDD